MIDLLLGLIYNTSYIVSFIVTVFVLALLFLPAILLKRYTAKKYPEYSFAAFGVGFGILAIPISYWLYLQFFVGPIQAFIIGFPGLFLVQWHLIIFGDSRQALYLLVLDPSQGLKDNLANISIFQILMWSLFYGGIGYWFDYRRNKKNKFISAG